MPYFESMLIADGAEVSVVKTPTLTVHANYVAGDYVGTSGVAIEFTKCASRPGGGGWIIGAELIDFAAQNIPMELWLFTSPVTPPADSAAWSISDADLLSCVAVIPFNAGDYFSSALNSVCDGAPLNGNKRYICAVTSLYGCLVTRGAPAYASGDLTVKLSLIQD